MAAALVTAIGPEEPALEPMAEAIGQAWATEIVHALRSVDREIIGAWPGTLREARMRVHGMVHVRLGLDHVDRLARIAYLAARRGWQQLSSPDPEP